MIRILLHYVVPLLLPAALYFLWRALRRPSGSGTGPLPAGPKPAPWLLLAAAGLVLMGLTLGVLALTGGVRPELGYAPPYMEEGRVVPAGPREDGAVPSSADTGYRP